MERNIYFCRMRETSAAVIPMLKRYYSRLSVTCPSLNDSLSLFVERRTNPDQCLLRPFLTRLAYEVVGGRDWSRILPVCAALEVFNISTYQSNLAFDGKNGVDSRDLQNNQFICSMISMYLTTQVLSEMTGIIALDKISKAIDMFHETNKDIYVGQFYDLNMLNISHFDLSMSLADYMELYLFRCEKLGGSLTRLCFSIGGLLANCSSRLLDAVSRIGLVMGIGGQIVNDIADLVLYDDDGSSKNSYRFAFSDIRMGKVTYPIFNLLKNGNREQRNLVLSAYGRKSLNLTEKRELSNLFVTSGSIMNARGLVATYYKDLKRSIRELPESWERNLLSLSFSSLLNNKYFTTIRLWEGNND